MAKAFASQADTEEKVETFECLADGAYCLTAEGDPNSGVVVGDDSVMVIDARATPVMARELVDHIRTVTDKPVEHVVLTHYHAVRVLGASGYGADHVIASDVTLELIHERGEQDMASEMQRFPRLFRAADSVPGLTWPTMTFGDRMTIWMGRREVQIIYAGRGHTKGDTVVWLPDEKVLFAGDLVEFGATPYCGDAYYTHWADTLALIERLGPDQMVPGRGAALKSAAEVRAGVDGTKGFLVDLFGSVKAGVQAGDDLRKVYHDTFARLQPNYGEWVIFEHCMPFNVTRAYDEAQGIEHPRIWTAERDLEMWQSLEGQP
ncbi:MAG: MBL fold metallo-hydrolase [Alphaproteobacteria bacterium]|nr:MBL fold metallo-hydrolase [Alphaproteobacteria bacterium]